MKQELHKVIISLASNDHQEQHLEAARQQLTLLLSDLHFTTEHWTDPVHNLYPAQYLNQLCEGTTTFSANLLEEERHHLRDWERHYIKDLLGELSTPTA